MGGHCQYEEGGGHLSGCVVCAYVCVGEGRGVDGGGGGLGCQWLSSETCKITFLNDAENMEIRLSLEPWNGYSLWRSALSQRHQPFPVTLLCCQWTAALEGVVQIIDTATLRVYDKSKTHNVNLSSSYAVQAITIAEEKGHAS